MNKKLSLVAGIAITSASIYSASLTAATVSGNASANVLAPLSIATGILPMNFGDVAGDATAATTVVLTPAGTTTASAGANASGSPTAGDFDVTGSGSLTYSISYPISATLTSPASDTIIVDTFTDNLGGSGSLTLGLQSFTVGATLQIGINQPAGLYSGTYAVTVNYN